VNGVVKEQTQPLIQGWVALQVPPHVVELRALLRNCRAERVPVHRTATAMIANDRFWIFFFMA
jgi:methylglyoxal synthase